MLCAFPVNDCIDTNVIKKHFRVFGDTLKQASSSVLKKIYIRLPRLILSAVTNGDIVKTIA
jgi:hypothetical protein